MKIGLLAMSGIRAHDPELLELGLTLPGFVERSEAIASLPSLGLLYLAADTPAGHELQYFEAEADGKEPTGVYRCDLVAISTFSAQVLRGVRDRRPPAPGGREGRDGRAARHRPAGRGRRARGLRDHRRRRATSGRRSVEAAARGDGPRVFHARDFAAVDVAAPSRAALRPARRSAVQPLHRADVARLSRGGATSAPRRDARPAVPQAAGPRRDPRHRGRSSRLRDRPVHRVRRRQHVRRQGVGQGAVPAARAAAA